MIRRRFVMPVAISAFALAAATIGAGGASANPAVADSAPGVSSQALSIPAVGSPGVTSHQGQSRKDCVGTARTTQSKIWFTVANGILSDVYAPTVDATNVETMQYLVTDGSSFTDLQSRDTTYTVKSDPTGMTCTVTSTAKSGAFRLVTTYLADPARDSVVVQMRYQALTKAAKTFKLYLRLDANAGGNGGGGTANGGADSAIVDTSTGSAVPVSFDTKTVSQANRTAYAVPSFLALTADRAFTELSSGFVGTASDSITQLDASHTLSTVAASATGGNVEQTVALQRDRDGSSTVALGFGTTQASAVATASATAASSVERLAASYIAGWVRYDASLKPPFLTIAGLSGSERLTAIKNYYQSANVVKASEDKTYPGAIVAGLDAPWGQSIVANDPNNLFVGGYKEVFARDLYEAWTALYTDGDIATAQDTVRYLLLHSQQANGSQPRNSLLDGTKAADAFNDQLDETAYPILMALQSGLAGDNTLWPHVKSAANFLVSHGPSFGVERWEEQTGYSPSTIAAEIAGLVSAASIADQHGDAADARIWRATADQYQRTIKTWGVTTTGPLSTSPYFIRLSKTGDPNAAISYNVGNGGPTLDQRSVVDAGFLEYVRLGILPATDPTIVNSLAVTDGTIQRPTDSGTGWLRYNGDGYGDCFVGAGTSCTVTGAPWTNGNIGTGHPWPVLGAERAQEYLAQGLKTAASSVLVSINRMNSGPGLVPEQVWDRAAVPPSPHGSDPATASIGFVNGSADGSASPLTWGSASQVRLTADLAAGRSLEQPAQVRDRYVTHAQGSTTLVVTAPMDGTATGATTVIRGMAAPGATIDVAGVATDQNSTSILAKTTAGANGSFSVTIASAAGTNVFVTTSTAPNGGTAQVVRSVVNDVVNGTLIFSADDPTGDDNGPGTYAYPTSGDFHPGAFDLDRFQVYDTGSTVTFRVQTADLTPTFGSTNGAQLVDVYVHNPAAVATSTASSYPGMNYSLSGGSAWNRLIEAQGFGNNLFQDASRTSVGTVSVSANQVSRYITFSVDKVALGGTPATGWGFTVTLTGQDGTHGVDQTRGFASTPQAYAFGVCSAGGTSPLCSADPNSVPKVLDTITATGTPQASELDYTKGPVVLTGVTIP